MNKHQILQKIPVSLKLVFQRLCDMKEAQTIQREGTLFSTKLRTYYYDTGTGKVIALNDDTAFVFRALFGTHIDLQGLLTALSKIEPNVVEEMLKTIDRERLMQRPHLEKMGEAIKEGVSSEKQKIDQVIFELTEQCNFRCKYCIYSEEFPGNRNFGNKKMTREIGCKALDWSLENSGEKLAVTFYGGEPLLNFGLMKEIIERTQNKKRNKEIVYSFTTNMSLMNSDIAGYLAKVPNMNITASIDGPASAHNAYRVYSDNRPTFEDSIKGLKTLIEAYTDTPPSVNINAVLTPPFDFDKIEEINAFFESLYWLPKTCYVNINYPSYGTCPGLEDYYDKIVGAPQYALNGACDPLGKWQLNKVKQDGLDPANSRNIYYRAIFDDLVKINNRLITDEPSLRPGLNGCCVPGKRRLYVTALGKYKACERIGASPSIGNVEKGIDTEIILKKYVEEFAERSKNSCENCWAYNLCRVCYAGIYNEDGLDIHLKNEACRSSRVATLNALVFYHELMEEKPEIFNCLKGVVVE